MDKTLDRILSLIPKKENGDFKHGELARFARSIGFKDGHIISDWIAGNSESYKNYIYQIADKYNVSVEWLKGETEQKEKPATENGNRQTEIDFIFSQLSPSRQAKLLELARLYLDDQRKSEEIQ